MRYQQKSNNKSMKKVLQVTAGMNRAGAETMIMNIYRHIDRSKLQFDFVVYSDEKQDYEDEIIQLGGSVIHIPIKRGIAMVKASRRYARY